MGRKRDRDIETDRDSHFPEAQSHKLVTSQSETGSILTQ